MMKYALLFVVSVINIIKNKGIYILFTTVVLFLLIQVFTKKRKERLLIDCIKSLFFAVTLSIILGTTLLGRKWFAVQDSFQWQVFYSYKRYIQSRNRDDLYEIIQNIILYIPFSCSIFVKYKRTEKFWCNVGVCSVISGLIEIIQGVTGMGLFQLDDVIHNSMGAIIGYALGKFISKRRKQHESNYN